MSYRYISLFGGLLLTIIGATVYLMWPRPPSHLALDENLISKVDLKLNREEFDQGEFTFSLGSNILFDYTIDADISEITPLDNTSHVTVLIECDPLNAQTKPPLRTWSGSTPLARQHARELPVNEKYIGPGDYSATAYLDVYFMPSRDHYRAVLGKSIVHIVK